MTQDDLFGHVTQKGEAPSTTGRRTEPIWSDTYGWIDPPIPYTADTMRAKFLRHIAEAKAATEVPWMPRVLQSYRAMAPYWAEWLTNGEGDRLLAEFRAELVRLGVDPIAPKVEG